jgi:hypothetical protein
MRYFHHIKLIVFFLCCTILVSNRATAFTNRHATKLLDYAYIGEFSKDKATMALKKLPGLDTLEVKHTLNLYKIHYQTTAPNGEMTSASGLVVMPIEPASPVAIVSYHHGTRVLRNDVPSNNDEKNYIYPAVFGSSAGYMVVMPDYLGLGDNTLTLHPYVEAETLASSSIDMLLAAKELAASLNYPVSDKLFLAGYSEGGFTTTVMYEALLKQHKEIHVTAVAPGSAPYDYNVTMHFITEKPGPRATIYLAYFFYSLQTYHHYWTGLDEIFAKPYDTLIPTLLDGKHTMVEIILALPKDPSMILRKEFFDGILNGTDRNSTQLEKEFNHYDFKATSPFFMVGTKGDQDVPYLGAELAYKVLKKNSEMVTMMSVSDVYDHLQAFPLVTRAQLAFFQQNS